MQIKERDTVLHISFADEPYQRANVFCGNFTKRQVGDKPYRPIEKDCKSLPFIDKQFDVIYCSHVLQFVDYPKQLLDEIRRVGKSAHIKEYSEFAELLYGWPDHKWILDIEDDKLVIKKKNPNRYSKFGPLFHRLYIEDPECHKMLSQSETVTKIAFDWYETDDEFEEAIIEEIEEIDDDSVDVIDKINEPVDDEISMAVKSISKQQKSIPIYRPTQTEYFDLERIELGKIQRLHDII